LRKSNTFAALGTIAHELTELIWKQGLNDIPIDDLKLVLEQKWDEYAQSSYKKLCDEWDGRDVPPPKDWPYYSMTRARTIRRLVNEVTEHRSNANVSRNAPGPLIETELVDESLRLKGIPDRVTFRDDGFYVFDIKTGHAVDEISAPYRRQLLLYAHLVKNHTGLEPLISMIALPMQRNASRDIRKPQRLIHYLSLPLRLVLVDSVITRPSVNLFGKTRTQIGKNTAALLAK
jgi:hypothetical protein